MKKITLSLLTVALLSLSAEADVTVKSNAATLKFSGLHYLGYTYHSDDANPANDVSKFETRRNYLQVKAYWNDKDYARITLDTKQAANVDGGSYVTRLKYAYLYLSDVLPHTGVEFGQVHRPWIDYAEHHGWLYRSISETFVETHHGAHVINSAAPGVNFKTKTENFSSEIGLFNNAGYHTVKTGTGQSLEWRLTYEAYGTGTKHVHPTKESYFNISYFGRYLTGTDNGSSTDTISGLHAVYNQPEFLLGGYYMTDDNDGGSHDGKGWSVNGEYRFMTKWSVIGRYDNWNVTSTGNDYHRKNIIYGLAYQYNKHVQFVANAIDYDPNDTVNNDDQTSYMFTAEVKW